MYKNETTVPRLIFNFTLIISFILGVLFYNSTNGTDFVRYNRYFEYFLGNAEYTSREQGVFYFWSIFKLAEIPTFFFESISIETLFNPAIQITNFTYYLIGTYGFFKLLSFHNFKKSDIYIVLTFLNVFPPLFGARLIMKPEIMAFAVLPWLIYLTQTYLKTKKPSYLIYLMPFFIVGLSAKAFITGSIGLLLLFIFFPKLKEFNFKELMYFTSILLVLLALVFYNDFRINNVGFISHELVAQYNYKAPLSFLYHIDINTLINNPYRDNLNDSFISILLLDMFGDYFERYWDHSRSLFMQDRFELDNLNLNLLRKQIASLMSFTFLFLSFKNIKNKEFRLYKFSYLIGIFLILMTSLGVFGTYFNPDKADTVKTHYYSFLLALSFIFVVMELIKNKKNSQKYSIFAIYLLLILFIFGFPKSLSYDFKFQIFSEQFFLFIK